MCSPSVQKTLGIYFKIPFVMQNSRRDVVARRRKPDSFRDSWLLQDVSLNAFTYLVGVAAYTLEDVRRFFGVASPKASFGEIIKLSSDN